MSEKPEALRLADELVDGLRVIPEGIMHRASAELRRLHAANIDCVNHFNALMEERHKLFEACETALMVIPHGKEYDQIKKAMMG